MSHHAIVAVTVAIIRYVITPSFKRWINCLRHGDTLLLSSVIGVITEPPSRHGFTTGFSATLYMLRWSLAILYCYAFTYYYLHIYYLLPLLLFYADDIFTLERACYLKRHLVIYHIHAGGADGFIGALLPYFTYATPYAATYYYLCASCWHANTLAAVIYMALFYY